MDLKLKKYLTFSELTGHLNISISDLLHLVVIGKITPAAHFNGQFKALFKDMSDLSEGDKDAIEQYGYTGGYQQEEGVVCSGIYPLIFRYGVGVNQCTFARFRAGDFRRGPSISKNMDLVGIEIPEPFHSDRLITEGVFYIDEIERFEKEYKSVENEKDSLEPKDISGKSETSYLNIIGALCELYWRAKNRRNATEKFNQAEVIRDLMDAFPSAVGLKDRNLKNKLTRAMRAIKSI